MLNAFTVDIEDWFHVCGINNRDINFENWDKCEDRVVKNTLKILDILDRYNVKATFFFLGWVAEKHPELVVKAKEGGHEIATHGYAHKLIYEQSQEEFAKDLEKSISIIENITKEKIKGYRGPGFSITEQSLWALKVVAEHGLKYDSTIFPAKRGHGGLRSAQQYPYLIEFERNIKLWEFPISTVKILGKNVPFSGGGYLRLLPYWFIREAIKKINRSGKPAIIYMHPREMDMEQPRIRLPIDRKFKYYINLSSMEGKIKALISDFQFMPVDKILGL